MITVEVQQLISEQLGLQVTSLSPVSGGDINEAYQLKCADGQSFFVKLNTNPSGLKMFEAEAAGLNMLAQFGQKTPEVISIGQSGNSSFLVLEFIETSSPNPGFWKHFGQQLAQLHRTFSDEFGLDHDNFIGTLDQANLYAYDWTSFYLNNRLEPQIQLAIKKGLLDSSDLNQAHQLAKRLGDLCPDEPPALIHGDLWSGNFLCNKAQKSTLIDPAICFAHREMDLAMSRLFGGFAPVFYQAYEEAYPLAPGFSERMEIYQLYYLLVHVNLFGYSYVAAVRRILSRFS